MSVVFYQNGSYRLLVRSAIAIRKIDGFGSSFARSTEERQGLASYDSSGVKVVGSSEVMTTAGNRYKHTRGERKETRCLHTLKA
jgi:hypothetical protein